MCANDDAFPIHARMFMPQTWCFELGWFGLLFVGWNCCFSVDVIGCCCSNGKSHNTSLLWKLFLYLANSIKHKWCEKHHLQSFELYPCRETSTMSKERPNFVINFPLNNLIKLHWCVAYNICIVHCAVSNEHWLHYSGTFITTPKRFNAMVHHSIILSFHRIWQMLFGSSELYCSAMKNEQKWL